MLILAGLFWVSEVRCYFGFGYLKESVLYSSILNLLIELKIYLHISIFDVKKLNRIDSQ